MNPYAAAYIPLAKRDSQLVEITHNQHHHKAVFGGDSLGMAEQLGQGDSYVRSSQNVSEAEEKQITDLDFDVVLAYLQTTFPGLSEQSLTDVYLVNNGDFYATVDMLKQLELHTEESSEDLPDTLDIGDVSESGSSAFCTSLKLKNVAGAAEGSSESGDSQVVS